MRNGESLPWTEVLGYADSPNRRTNDHLPRRRNRWRQDSGNDRSRNDTNRKFNLPHQYPHEPIPQPQSPVFQVTFNPGCATRISKISQPLK